MAVRRSSQKLSADQVRRMKREASRIDHEEAEEMQHLGRTVKARHDRLRDIVAVLKSERERRCLTLAQIEERSGIAKANLSRLENDPNANPTMSTLLRYADAVGCDIRVTVGDTGPFRRKAG